MTQHNRANRPAASARRDGDGKLLAVHFATVVLVVVDFVMFQAAAAGVTAGIYYTVPALDAGIMRGESSWTWIRIFQIVSPTITLPGGAATMLSSYFLARRAQEEARRAQQAETRVQEEAQRAQQAETRIQEESRRAEEAEIRIQEAARRAEEAEIRIQEVARRAQEEAEIRIQEVARRAQEEAQRAQEQARRADAAEDRAENLQAQLERSRSPRRRRLRNAATRPPAAR